MRDHLTPSKSYTHLSEIWFVEHIMTGKTQGEKQSWSLRASHHQNRFYSLFSCQWRFSKRCGGWWWRAKRKKCRILSIPSQGYSSVWLSLKVMDACWVTVMAQISALHSTLKQKILVNFTQCPPYRSVESWFIKKGIFADSVDQFHRYRLNWTAERSDDKLGEENFFVIHFRGYGAKLRLNPSLVMIQLQKQGVKWEKWAQRQRDESMSGGFSSAWAKHSGS